jgi:hypothetical protein
MPFLTANYSSPTTCSQPLDCNHLSIHVIFNSSPFPSVYQQRFFICKLLLLYFLYFSYNLYAGCPSIDAYVIKKILKSSFKHDIFKGIFMIFLSSLVEIIHVELNSVTFTCRTNEV